MANRRAIFALFALVLAAVTVLAPPAQASASRATSSASVQAGSGWSWSGPLPEGNNLNSVACADVGHCVTVGNFGTILATNSPGVWQAVGPGFELTIHDVACRAANDCTVVGDAGAILGTSDGVTWTSRPSGTGAYLTGITCPSALLCLAAGSVGTVLRSVDGGATWARQTSGTTRFLQDVTCSTVIACVAVGFGGTVIVSGDGGVTWTGGSSGTTTNLISTSCPSASICVAVGGTTALRSTDGGAHWTPGTVPAGTSSLFGAACPSTSTCFAVSNVSSIGQVLMTGDGGATWSARPFSPGMILNGVACTSSSTCVTVGAWGAIAGTSDGGANWTFQGSGIHTDLGSVSCPTTGVCFTSGDAGVILRSGDGGVTWASQSTGTTGRIWGVSCGTATTCAAPPLYTVDGGTTWTKGPALNTTPTAVACPTIIRCYFASPGKIFMSNDGGATWTPEYSSGSAGLWGLGCATATFCIAVGDAGTILETTDGSTWSAKSSGSTSQLHAVSCPSTSTCYVIGLGVLVTSNGGSSWSTLAGSPPGYGINCPTTTTCFTGNSATADGGVTWFRQPLLASPGIESVSCPAADACVAVGAFGGILKGTNLKADLPRKLLLPAMSNGAYGGYVTASYIRNLGTALANVVIKYFDQAGSQVGAGDWAVIPPGGAWTVRQDNFNSLDTGQAGSAIVYSDQPLSGFVNEFAPTPTGDATSYTSVPTPAGSGSVLYAPAILNGAYGGYTTGIGLLVAGDSATDVTITYRDTSGAPVLVQSLTGLAPRSYVAVYSGGVGLPAPFAGTATIASSGSALAAIVNEVGPGGQFSSYNAIPAGSATLYIPVALNNAYGGYYTGMGIQNTTATAGTLQVDYYDSTGGVTTRSIAISANGYLGIYQGSATDGPPVGAYTSVISGSPGLQFAVIVNEVAPILGSAQQSTSFNAFAAGAASSSLALAESTGPDGFSTGEGIMNVGSAPAGVLVSYFDAWTGNPVGTPQANTVPPHAFLGVYQPTSGLPAGLIATAVVTATGGLVAVVCNESSVQSFMSYGGQ